MRDPECGRPLVEECINRFKGKVREIICGEVVSEVDELTEAKQGVESCEKRRLVCQGARDEVRLD